jgi:hypothetical protein
MGDAFRDELEAAQQRADALEQERDALQKKVAGLEKQLEAKLEAKDERPPQKPPEPPAVPGALPRGAIVGLIALAGLVAYAFIRWISAPEASTPVTASASSPVTTSAPSPHPSATPPVDPLTWSFIGRVGAPILAVARDPAGETPWLFGKQGTVWPSSRSASPLATTSRGAVDTKARADLLGGVAIDWKHIVAVGRGGTIVSSDDGGNTWKQAKSGTPWDLYGVADGGPLGRFAVGEHGTILRSAADGWHVETTGTPWTAAT